MEPSGRHTVANTEFPSGGRYVFHQLVEHLVSDIVVIVEIVPGYDDFIVAGSR